MSVRVALGKLRDKFAGRHVLRDAQAFFDGIRGETGALKQQQVDTINLLLTEAAQWPVSWMAYGLVTAWHEARFIPQEEWGHGGRRPYAQPGIYGQPQYGRGLVQLTWDRNYEWADAEAAKAGLIEKGDLLKNFDLALQPDIAVLILVRGMEQGAFTGRSLKTYLPRGTATLPQFRDARHIINGKDRALSIAMIAMKFQRALQAGKWN